MLENQLKQLGFNKNETRVYLALFELGKCKAGQIIEYTKLHRNLVYTSLEELLQKKIISKIEKNGIFLFEANNPKTIIEIIEEKKLIAEAATKELLKKQKTKPSDINVYEGLDGTRKVLNKSIEEANPGDTLYVMGASKFSNTEEMEKKWKTFHKNRIKKGIGFKILYDKSTNKDIVNWRNNLPITEAKYFPFNIETPVRFRFINDLLDIGILGDDPVTFTIRSKEAVNALKKYFDYFWNQKVIMQSGIESLEKTIYDMLNELESGEEYLVLGASAGDNSSDIQKLYDKFHTDRIKKGVVTKMLVYRESLEKIKKRYHDCGDPNGKISFVKTYSTTPATPMQINMFHNKAFIILYGDEPTIIHFDQKEIYDGFKKYFEELWKQETQIIKGPEVVKQIWLESLETGELKFIGAQGYFVDRYPEMFSEILEKAKKIPNLKWQNIVDSSAKNHPLNQLPWMEVKYNISNSKNPNVVWLWGDKVALANWTETEPVVMISTNKTMVESYNDYFKELWNQKTKTYQGNIGFDAAFGDILNTLKPGEELLVAGIFEFDAEFREKIIDFHTKRAQKKH